MLEDMKKEQLAQKQQLYVGFTPLDPKHRIVLERCEQDIEELEAKFVTSTLESEDQENFHNKEQPAVVDFSELEEEVNRLEERLGATSAILSRLERIAPD